MYVGSVQCISALYKKNAPTPIHAYFDIYAIIFFFFASSCNFFKTKTATIVIIIMPHNSPEFIPYNLMSLNVAPVEKSNTTIELQTVAPKY